MRIGFFKSGRAPEPSVVTTRALLAQHFGVMPGDNLVTAGRTFPVTTRVDLQLALEQRFSERYPGRLVGVHAQYSHETVSFPYLVTDGHYPVVVGPLQYEEIDVGETMAARCLKHGLWLSRAQDVPFAVLIAPAQQFGHSIGVHVEIAVPPGEPGAALSRVFLDDLESLVAKTGSYRGKVLSLEAGATYAGKAGSVKVHRLRAVNRQDVILPEKTLRLMERNVHDFIRHRSRLRALGLPVKKGLLFYGPPGTGKTHTIHYLAGQLPEHTTLLITAEQVGLLDEYFQLARFLQPAMVVIEDVDLIARARDEMRNSCEESLLNKLLNEMDGLREDAELLFVLTTNRPDQLEAALASRPGRVDQAIEFPLPDAEGRRRLILLYSRGVQVPDAVVDVIVQRTDRASAAFIKELMRRAAQYQIDAGAETPLAIGHVECALDEMLFSGGSLNVRLLGGAAADEPAV